MKITAHWPEVTKHLIALTLGWGAFSILLGLFFSFDTLEASEVASVTEAIPEFLQVAAITFLSGSIAFCLPLFIWKSLNKSTR
jgi:hypothetical protein